MQGTEIAVGYLGRLFKIRLVNEDNSDVSIYEIAFKITSEGGVNVQNIAGKSV